MARPGASRSTTASSDTLHADTDSAADSSSYTGVSTITVDTTRKTRTSSERAKRVSGLKEGRGSEEQSTTDTKGRTVSGETLVEKATASQSSLLQQGLAALNLPWSMGLLFKSAEYPEPTKEPDFAESTTSLVEPETPRRIMMKERAERVKAKREKDEAEMAERVRKDKEKATRRSSRLNIVEKATQVVDAATSVLGKRSRDVLEKGKDRLGDLKRRASLRPRESDRPAPPSFEGPVPKRARLDDSKTAETKETTIETATAITRKPIYKPKTKRWLAAGLYVGQRRDFDPRLTDAKNRARLAGKPEAKERKYLPLPMFAGQRLIERGRDFKLPFDVFSPLPPGQPKPDEWKKTNKSKYP
jgi:histone-lysine N-methyltransferase ASH1L